MDTSKIDKIISSKELELSLSLKRLRDIKSQYIKSEAKLKTLEMAKSAVIELGINTQDEIKRQIEEIVTAALHSVFGTRYDSFKVVFTVKRNQPEVNFYIEEGGKLLDIRQDTVCGGVVDVVSYVLRLTQWKVKQPEVSPLIILDEPFKNVSHAYRANVSKMVQEVTTSLGLQIIMVTHKTNLIASSDNIIEL